MSGGPMSDLAALNKWLGEQPKPKTIVDELHDRDITEILDVQPIHRPMTNEIIHRPEHHVSQVDGSCMECWDQAMRNPPEGVEVLRLEPNQQSVENVYNALHKIFGE